MEYFGFINVIITCIIVFATLLACTEFLQMSRIVCCTQNLVSPAYNHFIALGLAIVIYGSVVIGLGSPSFQLNTFCMTNVQEEICSVIKIGGKPVKDVINCANVMEHASEPEQFYFDGYSGMITVDPVTAG